MTDREQLEKWRKSLPRDLKPAKFLALAKSVVEAKGEAVRKGDKITISHPLLLEYRRCKGKSVRVYVTHKPKGKAETVVGGSFARG
jgi:hypothetical protein